MEQSVQSKREQALEILQRSSSLTDAAIRRCAIAPDEVVVSEAQVTGPFTPKNVAWGPRSVLHLTRSEFLGQASQVAHFLLEQGIQIGDRIATLPSLRHEWLVIREGIRLAGAAHVAIFGHYPTDKIAHILSDAMPALVFLENEEQAAKLKQIFEGAPLNAVRCIALESVQSIQAIPYRTIAGGERYSTESPRLARPLHGDDLADLNYTSGTKGTPKGVMQTHANHLANTAQVTQSDVFAPGKKLFPLLRPAHSYCARMQDMGTLAGGEILLPAVTDRASSHLTDARRLSMQRDVIELGTQVLATAPAALEAMFERVCANWFARGIARHAAEGRSLSRVGRFVLERARQRLFPETLEYVISGGARLTEEIARFFGRLGAPIYNGYGATESDVVVATNTPSQQLSGTVGRPLPGVGVEIIRRDDGQPEIVVSGPQVAKGYWRLPEATIRSFRDGKYFTGDTGALDDDGYLHVAGRLDDVVKLKNGEKVALEALEERLLELCPSIGKVIVWADAQRSCTALIVLDRTAVLTAAKQYGIALTDPPPLEDPFVTRLIRYELASANAKLEEHHTRVRAAQIVPAEAISETAGTIGPTLKLVRPAVQKAFAAQLQHLIEEAEHHPIPNSGTGLEPLRTPSRWRAWLPRFALSRRKEVSA